MARFEKALADWPKTAAIRKGGIRITGKYEQATFDSYNVAATLLIIGLAMFVGANSQSWLAAFIVFVGSALFWQMIGVGMFGKTIDIKIYPDRIEAGGKRYSRAMPMEFRVEQHHKAIEEVEKEHRTNRRQKRTYREAIEVVLQYGEKRVVLAEMKQKHQEMARALVIRLQNVCASVDLANAGAGAPKTGASPNRESDFGPAPDVR